MSLDIDFSPDRFLKSFAFQDKNVFPYIDGKTLEERLQKIVKEHEQSGVQSLGDTENDRFKTHLISSLDQLRQSVPGEASHSSQADDDKFPQQKDFSINPKLKLLLEVSPEAKDVLVERLKEALTKEDERSPPRENLFVPHEPPPRANPPDTDPDAKVWPKVPDWPKDSDWTLEAFKPSTENVNRFSHGHNELWAGGGGGGDKDRDTTPSWISEEQNKDVTRGDRPIWEQERHVETSGNRI